jgi:hypothetical protein
MAKLYTKECPCCLEKFETNRIDKIYKNYLHQRKYNNEQQAKKRKQLSQFFKPINATYKIYNELLVGKTSVKKSKEFLRGKGANLEFFSHVDKVNEEITHFLYDIAIIDNGSSIILKKTPNYGNRKI